MPKKKNDMAEARAASAAKAQVRARSVAQRVQEILANERVDSELKRKLQYCQDEIAKGRRDTLLTDRRGELIREAERVPWG